MNNLPLEIADARFSLGIRLDYTEKVFGVPETMVGIITDFHQLLTFACSWNKSVGFVPNFGDSKQEKWIPSFAMNKETGAFECVGAKSLRSSKVTTLDSLCCFHSSDMAKNFGTQFIKYWDNILKISDYRNAEIK